MRQPQGLGESSDHRTTGARTRQDLDEVRVGGGEELEVALRAEDCTAALDGTFKPVSHLARLLLFTAVEGDGLGVFAQADERVAQIGLAQQDLRVLANKRLAKADRGERAEGGVRKDKVEEVGVDRVQDAAKGDQINHGSHDVDEEVERDLVMRGASIRIVVCILTEVRVYGMPG